MGKVKAYHTVVPEYGAERDVYHDQIGVQQECGLSRSTEVLGKQGGPSARIAREYVENDGPTVGLMG